MYSLNDLYELRSSQFCLQALASYEGPGYNFTGEALPTGPDAAIEIVDGTISAFLNGQPCPQDHGLCQITDNYDASILRSASKLAKRPGTRVIFVGRYVHSEPRWYDPMFVGYLLHIVSPNGKVRTSKYDLDVFDWDDVANGSSFDFASTKGSLHRNPAQSLFSVRRSAEEVLDLDNAIRTEAGEHYLDGVIYFPTKKIDWKSLPILIVRGIGLKGFENECLLASGDGDVNRAFAKYNMQLDAIKRLAASPDEFAHGLEDAYECLKLDATGLIAFGYQPQLDADLRAALTDSQFGHFRDAIRRRVEITESATFSELYDAGIIDNAVLELSIEEGSHFWNKEEVSSSPSQRQIRRTTKTFDLMFRRTASKFDARSVDKVPHEEGSTSHRYESEWSDWGNGRLARLLA